MLPACLHIGSVKNIHGVLGEAPFYFEFSNRYSVFDWGSMPDSLESKGDVLATMASFFFDYLGDAQNWNSWTPQSDTLAKCKTMTQLKQSGLRHHGLGRVNTKLEQLAPDEFSNIYKVTPVSIIKPKALTTNEGLSYDYTPYKEKVVDALVPLEVIFRFGVPSGSSLLKRVKDAAYLEQLGLSYEPKVGDIFENPVIEFSTKLENVDRYISYGNAQEIAGLSDRELENLIETTKLLACRLKDIFKGIDVELWDGKYEYAFAPELQENGDRKYMLVDSIGPDELRLMYNGVQLSKECLRKFYRKTPWYENVEKAKDIADEEGVEDWKSICTDRLNSKPPQLDTNVKETVEMMYKTLMQQLYRTYLKNDVYPNSWSLTKVATSLEEILDD